MTQSGQANPDDVQAVQDVLGKAMKDPQAWTTIAGLEYDDRFLHAVRRGRIKPSQTTADIILARARQLGLIQ